MLVNCKSHSVAVLVANLVSGKTLNACDNPMTSPMPEEPRILFVLVLIDYDVPLAMGGKLNNVIIQIFHAVSV